MLPDDPDVADNVTPPAAEREAGSRATLPIQGRITVSEAESHGLPRMDAAAHSIKHTRREEGVIIRG